MPDGLLSPSAMRANILRSARKARGGEAAAAALFTPRSSRAPLSGVLKEILEEPVPRMTFDDFCEAVGLVFRDPEEEGEDGAGAPAPISEAAAPAPAADANDSMASEARDRFAALSPAMPAPLRAAGLAGARLRNGRMSILPRGGMGEPQAGPAAVQRKKDRRRSSIAVLARASNALALRKEMQAQAGPASAAAAATATRPLTTMTEAEAVRTEAIIASLLADNVLKAERSNLEVCIFPPSIKGASKRKLFLPIVCNQEHEGCPAREAEGGGCRQARPGSQVRATVHHDCSRPCGKASS